MVVEVARVVVVEVAGARVAGRRWRGVGGGGRCGRARGGARMLAGRRWRGGCWWGGGGGGLPAARLRDGSVTVA